MKSLMLMLLLPLVLWGCAGNPLETNSISKDGRIYHESEDIEAGGETRSTIKVQGATF